MKVTLDSSEKPDKNGELCSAVEDRTILLSQHFPRKHVRDSARGTIHSANATVPALIWICNLCNSAIGVHMNYITWATIVT